jgi:hypothetical protein
MEREMWKLDFGCDEKGKENERSFFNGKTVVE